MGSSSTTLRFDACEIATLDAAMARQKLGQHFLADLGWRKKILQTLSVAPGETWLEIGAGHGEMTELLAQAGARVVAIETDSRLAEGLRRKSADWGRVEIICADVLQIDLREAGGERFRVYGNLPYYITSPILRRLFDFAGNVASIHIVIQLEVAERIVARPGRRDYGYLSVLCQYFARPEILLRIPAGAFRPPPRVTSALVRMDLPGERAELGIDDDERFLEFVGRCFGQKRKTLRNNLRGVAEGARLEALLEECGLALNARAEELRLQQFAGIYRAI